MISNILIPTDFSAVADNALRYAIRFAEKAGAHVHVLHVNGIPAMDPYFLTSAYPAMVNEVERSSTAKMEKLRSKYAKSKVAGFKTHMATGDIYTEIRTCITREKIDLVIMGTAGAGRVEGILFGSTAASVVAGSSVPVLVVPPKARYRHWERVVYATDLSDPEFPAVSRLKYFAKLYDSEVTVLHIRSEYDSYFDSSRNFFVRNRNQRPYNSWRIATAPGKDVMSGIERYLGANRSDVLVLARHNRAFFDRVFHRSLSRQMTYHTDIPLLVLHKR